MLAELAELVDGVVAMHDQLTYQQDDLAGVGAPAAQSQR